MMENKKDKKIIKIIVSIIIVLVISLIFVIIRLSLERKNEAQEIERVKSYTTIDDFKTVEEVAKYLECDYIKQEKSKEENYKLDIYIKIKILPYTDDSSNEVFYNNLVSYCAKVLKFDNFRIIDKEHSITIEVVCNKEKENIKSIIINGESNYFAKRDSEAQVKNYKEIKQTDITIQSDILKNLINNKWRLKESDIGTKESTFNSYDIYFDEGIEVRKVDNKVFNIVFTDKYKQSVANNITTATSKEDIIKILGTPTFEDEYTKTIGYKGKDIYLFYNQYEHQISIYPVIENYETEEFAKCVTKYLNGESITDLINDIKEIWSDYDICKIQEDKIILQYSLKGLCISINDGNENGVVFYNNYKGNISEDIDFKSVLNGEKELPDKLFMNNEDLVYNYEIIKMSEYFGKQIELNEDINNNEKKYKSSKFHIYAKNNGNDEYLIQLISKDNECPDVEIKEYINYYMWLDDYNLVYSIKNKGIYVFNTKYRKYGTILTGDEEFKLTELENGILKYDEKTIKLK